MAKKLICYKDVWQREEGDVYVVGTKEGNKLRDELRGIMNLDDDNFKVSCVGSGSMALSFTLKLYDNRDAYNNNDNVYQTISFEHKPSKDLITELLRATDRGFAHLEYVVRNEETYECKK